MSPVERTEKVLFPTGSGPTVRVRPGTAFGATGWATPRPKLGDPGHRQGADAFPVRRPVPGNTAGLVVFVGVSRYCWTRSTIGMMVGGCASSMPNSSMTGPRYVRNSSNASWLSQTSKT